MGYNCKPPPGIAAQRPAPPPLPPNSPLRLYREDDDSDEAPRKPEPQQSSWSDLFWLLFLLH